MTETEIRKQCVAEIAAGLLTLLSKPEYTFTLPAVTHLFNAMLPVFEKAKLPKASIEETK